MRISGLFCLLTGVVIFCSTSSCKQNRQSPSVTTPPEKISSVKDSVVLPVTVLVTMDAIDGRQSNAADYPKTIALDWFDTTATPVAVYGASQGLWMGPKGFTGSAATGADGSVAIRLFPQGGNEANPPFVRYERIPACVGCMMSAAAPYFANAKTDLLNNYGSAMPDMVRMPNELVVQKRSLTLVTYTYMEGSSSQITGVAFYSSPGDSTRGDFEQAEFALGPDNKALTALLLNRYISMWGLK